MPPTSNHQPRSAFHPTPAPPPHLISTTPSQESEPSISNCVTSIVQAFTRGLDVFKRLRERRRRRKDGKRRERDVNQDVEDVSPAEMRLSKSLCRAPGEIWDEYERGVGGVGEKFGRGDAIAHASLASTLLKLNTGLVNIITTFIGHGDKKSKGLDLDYKSLTDLSEASRAEAIKSLNQLYHRLSQSNIMLVYQPKEPQTCPKCQRAECAGCSKESIGRKRRSDGTENREAGNRTHRAQRDRHRRRGSDTSTVITRMPLGSKANSQSQLVIVRPKAQRKNSSTSTSSSSSNHPTSPSTGSSSVTPKPGNISVISGSASSSRPLSPLISPLPESVPRQTATNIQRRDHKPRPSKPKSTSSSTSPTKRSHHHPKSPSHNHQTQPELSPCRIPSPLYPPPPSPSPSPPTRRRTDKLTPSTYTFASDSTKLGEIPMRNWTRPWDFEDAERRNREEGRVVEEVQEGGEEKGKRGRGLRFWRRE